ncbi:MAG: metalloregulator ArsR/SmtB family transcription factor [Phycisphaerales bacterium]|nr:metalloregulator ArsR/SmtB family transcription factor [Phycisphaerales bacterium]
MIKYNQMVNNPAIRLDQIFGALADPTRRGILEMLSRGATNVRTLASPFRMSQPAISKHLRVLESAGLIRRDKRGREHRISVNTQPVEQARDWIAHYTQFWKQQFDAVEDYLKQQEQNP